MRPAPAIAQPPKGLLSRRKVPGLRSALSPSRVQRSGTGTLPGLASRDCRARDPARRGDRSGRRLSTVPGRMADLGVLPPRHQSLRVEGHSFRSAWSRFPFAFAWGSGLRPFLEGRLTLSQGPAADPGDERNGEPPRSSPLKPNSRPCDRKPISERLLLTQ